MYDKIMLAMPCFGEFIAALQIEYYILGRGRLPRAASIGLALLLWAASQWLHGEYVVFSVGTILFNVLRFFAASLLLGGSISRKLFSIVVCGVVVLGYENVLSTFQAVLAGKSMSEAYLLPGNILFYGVCLNALVFVGARALRRWLRLDDPAQKMAGSIYLCVMAALNVLLCTLGNTSNRYGFIFLLCIGMLLSLMVYFALLAMLGSKTLQAELEQQRADALTESYRTQRRLTHEFENHMGAVSFYLDRQDVQGAKAYLASVSQKIAAGTAVVNTHNPLMDALLSKEHRSAVEKDVLLNFDLCDLADFPLQNADLVTLICNLLDNAIGAAAHAAPPQVTLRIRRLGEEYVISVRNRVQGDIPLRRGELPPSTKDEPGHGMGLANVKAVVERSGGEYTLSCKDRWFCFTCTVPCLPAAPGQKAQPSSSSAQ